MASDEEFGWLVYAVYVVDKTVRRFPVYTVICERAEDAYAYVQRAGFCFSRGMWKLQAERVAMLAAGQEQQKARGA